MIKTYVLDTNVLLHDPQSYTKFEDNLVIIPFCVLTEIDKFKKELTEKGRNARVVARSLDAMRSVGSLAKGVPINGKGEIKIIFPSETNPLLNNMPADEQILSIAKQIKEQNKSTPCIVISKDITMRLKADAIGLVSEDYESGQVKLSPEAYFGHTEIEVDSDFIDAFEKDKKIKLTGIDLSSNQYVTLLADNKKDSALARYDSSLGMLVQLIPTPQGFGSIRPRNRGQRFAIDALLNDEIPLVTLTGKAGTGKTLMALAAALYKVQKKVYNKVLVSRPVFPMGKDLGFLPGDVNEKFAPWIQPIYDALEVIEYSESKKPQSSKSNSKSIPSKNSNIEPQDTSARFNGLIEVEPLTYIRGRSLPKQFIIVDEAQNLTPLEVKTVITRVGTGTKIVLTGDIYQIDNPYVDLMSNGLNAVADKFREEPMAAHIYLDKGERSKLAELASNLL